MTDRPILFSAPMIRALLAGTKTQTRRLMKPPKGIDPDDPNHWSVSSHWIDPKRGIKIVHWPDDDSRIAFQKPFCFPGDRLWVKETHAFDGQLVRYYATDAVHELRKKRPSIHMPRWASRLTLTVTEVRVQRLQEISEEDARAEGVIFNADLPDDGRHRHCIPIGGGECISGWSSKECYADLWQDLHGPDSWEANPWVVAVSFDVRKGNIDG